MSIKLEDYEACMKQAAPEIHVILESTFQEAARLMSPAGLQEFLEGGKGLCELGRGSGIVISYLEQMPLVIKECGEDIIRDCLNAAL